MRVWNCIVFAMFVAACTSSSDSGEPPDPGPDPQIPGSGDDGSDQQAPAGAACAEPGAAGNSEGVGEYCTPGGGECDDNESATFCTVDYRDGVPPFCTVLCLSEGSCGEDAVCAGDGSGPMGCTPACLAESP